MNVIVSRFWLVSKTSKNAYLDRKWVKFKKYYVFVPKKLNDDAVDLVFILGSKVVVQQFPSSLFYFIYLFIGPKPF